ncbi:cytotoxic and regulatory T-cell molecule [Apteryx rowi]|uniref:cytotoxic and regulatory T-cell molecule n=1 Tax=Apteryx rowi TaxID=308060 RepID=UPI000E1C8C5E|nr:cytotoxic and regulatory T-cell molecule [Apteryx rowi]
MTFTRVLHIAALLLMQGDFPGVDSETVTLKEGEDLNLHCSLGSDDSSARQWLNPHGFVIFLNTQRGLRDQRYKLIHYSNKELSIRLSNVTVHDEGIYKCFYYGALFKTKNETVEVLAAPSKPVVEASQDTEKGTTLSCYTKGSKPQPRITWQLDNGIELPGDTKHKLEADGKKWTTTSTLTVLAYRPNSTSSCVVHHEVLREEKLTASFRFESFTRTVITTSPAPTALDVDTSISENERSTVTTAKSDLKSSTAFSLSYPQYNGSEITPAAAGDEDFSGTSNYNVPNGTGTAFNGTVTEELYRTEASPLSENLTVISTITFKQDLKSEGIKKKEKNLLLPILVAALIFVLLIIVLLFMRKLKKAHGLWKRENDTSEQTLESYKSRSNEDNPGHEKNGQVVNQKPNVQYVTEGHVETTQKNPRDKNFAIAEKLSACGKETDV